MFKKWLDKLVEKRYKKSLEDQYVYNIRLIIKDAIELYDNTWDKDRVKRIILNLCSLNLDKYSTDMEIQQMIQERIASKLKEEEWSKR